MPKCPKCHKELPPASRFCPACGASTALPGEVTATHEPLGEETPVRPLSPMPTSSGSARFAPGQVLAERYRIVSRLGKGGMGEVYRADDLRLGQSVALKFLPANLRTDTRALALLHEEVRLTRQISHPNVCRVYDIAEANGLTFISMEFIDGEDLASLLRRIGRLPHDKGVEIARQLCMGMAAAHEQGVIHRDLKPANIMLDGRGHVRVTDFGLARVAEQVAGSEARAGTPGYMAPEQLSGKEATARSDVYALGLVLYEIFTGKRPFHASSIPELQKLQEQSTPTSPSSHVADLDATVERVILRCLERDPSKRPTSVIAVAAALPGGDPLAAALAAGETPSPEMVAAAGDSAAWTPHHSLVTFVITLLALLGCVWLYDKGMLAGRVGMPVSVDVLTDKAKDLLVRDLKFETPRDWAVGFDHDEDFLKEIQERDTSADRWKRLEQSPPAALYFWYRQSQTPLVPDLFYPYPGTLEPGRITLNEPPPVAPGMVSVKFDTGGRLLELNAVPPSREDGLQPVKNLEWTAFLFHAAQLDLANFKLDKPNAVPPNFGDERLAWVEKEPKNPELPIRVEAATFRGRPIYFEVLVSAVGRAPPAPGFQGMLDPYGKQLGAIVFVGVLITAALLAPRSWKHGRSDRKGAFRLALASFIILMIVWAFETHHVASLDELRLLTLGLAFALYWSGLLWMTYIALEPYVRQMWPEALITWTRVLSGQWRDPRVGRDLLLGACVGALLQVVDLVGRTAPVYLDMTTPVPYWDWWIPNTHVRGYWMGNFLINLVYSFRWAFFYKVLLYLVIRVLFKRPMPAAVVYILLSAALWIGNSASYQVVSCWFFAIVIELIILALLIKVGVLADIAATFAWYCVCFPLTMDPTSWYFQYSLMAIAAVVLLAGFGFYTSLAGRSLFQDDTAIR